MNRSTINSIAFFALTTIIIIIPALFNGYPIVHQDSGHYLYTSRSLHTNATNPPGYSLFIRAVTWQSLVWLIAVVQGIILNFYLFYSMKALVPNLKIHFKVVYLFIISILSIFTGMGWFVTRIMPDIFTAYAILGIYFFIRKESSVFVRIINGVIIFWACISHFSNIYVFLLLFILLFLFYYLGKSFRNQYNLIAIICIIPILISANIFIRSYNYFNNNGFITAKYKHGAIMAKFIEYGILDDYLEKACAQHDFSLCQHKGQFPNTTGNFIWDDNSPFNKYKSWEKIKDEYNLITREILSQPRYIFIYLSKSVYSSLKQFFRIAITAGPKNKGTGPYNVIESGFPMDFQSYKSTLQYWDKLPIKYINPVYYLLYAISVFYILYLVILKKLNHSKMIFYLVIIFGTISNAIVFGTLATVIDRFQSRIGWILIFLAFSIFIDRNLTSIKGLYNKYQLKS